MIYTLKILATYAIIISAAVESPPAFVRSDYVPDPEMGIHGAPKIAGIKPEPLNNVFH